MTPDDFYGEIVRKARQRQAGRTAQGARRPHAEARRDRWQQSQERLVAAQRARDERREQALAAFWPDDGLEDE